MKVQHLQSEIEGTDSENKQNSEGTDPKIKKVKARIQKPTNEGTGSKIKIEMQVQILKSKKLKVRMLKSSKMKVWILQSTK